MISDYLNRVPRDRLSIARDMAFAEERDWNTISTIADGFDVMFAVTGVTNGDGQPKFLHVSSHSWPLTGYWPNELIGQNPKVLQTEDTNQEAAAKFIEVLTSEGSAEARLLNRRKNGELYGCHLLADKAEHDLKRDRDIFFAFLCECPRSECA